MKVWIVRERNFLEAIIYATSDIKKLNKFMESGGYTYDNSQIITIDDDLNLDSMMESAYERVSD